jgi:hypothetical protein
MDKPSIQIKNIAFPNQMASDAEKESSEYGLKVGHAIQGEWFRRVGNDSCKYYSQYGEFHRLRLYSRGEQSISKYKSELSYNGDLSYINLDWTPVPIIPKFVDILVNGIQDRLYAVKVESQDVMSAEKKNLFQDMVEADMVAKDFLAQTKEQFGIDAFNVPQNEIPETSEELSLYMQLKYKPSIEIAEEIALNTILNQNDYNDTIKPSVDKDIAVIGIGAVKHEFNPASGLEISYVDPASLVYSYTEKKDFSDCYYFGEVKQLHITELLKIDPTLTEEDIKDISQTAGAWYNHFPIVKSFNDDTLRGEMVSLLFFNYKTSKRFAYKRKFLKNGGERIIKKSDTFRPIIGEDDNFGMVESIKDVWYEGVLVLGSNKLLKWNLLKNMVRPNAATQKALPNYVVCAPNMYNGVIESIVRRMIPFADQIQLTHLKLQQVMSRVVPDGVFIDADGLNEVDLGNGAAYNPEEALKLYFQTGSVVGRSNTMEGEFNNARIPIQELATNSGQSKMQALIGVYNYNLNMIRDVTGLNEARDGSMPNSDALVGVQKLAALNSNIATRHILEGGLLITKRLANCISLRIADILKYADFREEFAMQIGNYNLAILDDIKDLYLHSFGIFIELEPDEEERQQTEANIQMALSRDQIDLEDAIDIRTIKNLKLANEMLKVKRRKKMEAAQKSQEMQMQMQMQSNMQSQQAAAEAKQQQIQMEAQSKIAIINAQSQSDMQKLDMEVEKKKELMSVEFEYNMQLKGIETDNLKSREKAKEDAKDERVKKQATAQSKLIEQRQNNLPPVDFESSGNDALGDFNLEAFEPR